MGSFSIAHWLIVLVVVALIFGPKRFAEMGAGLGKGIKSFKKGIADEDNPAKSGEPRDPNKNLT
jgi:sec-independent protein translocase protein TatA